MNTKSFFSTLFTLLLVCQSQNYGMLTTIKHPQKLLKQKSSKKTPKRFYNNKRNQIACHAQFKMPKANFQQNIQHNNNISLKKLKDASDIQKYSVKESSKRQKSKNNQENSKEYKQFQDQNGFEKEAATSESSLLKKTVVIGGVIGTGYLLSQDILGNQKDRLEKNIIALKEESQQHLFQHIDNLFLKNIGRSFSDVISKEEITHVISDIYRHGSIHEYIVQHKDEDPEIKSKIIEKISYIITPRMEQKLPKSLRGTTFSKQLIKNFAQSLFSKTQTDEGLAIINKIDAIIKDNIESSKNLLHTWGTVFAGTSLSALTQFLINPNISSKMEALQRHATKRLFFVPTVRFVGLLGAFDIGLHGINKVIELRKEKNDISKENEIQQNNARKYAVVKYLLDTYIYYQADMNNIDPEDVTLNDFIRSISDQKDITQQNANEILKIIKGELIPLARNEKTTKRRVIEALIKTLGID